MLVPVIGLVQVGDQARADRYMYLPGIGLCIVLAWGAAAVGQTLLSDVGATAGLPSSAARSTRENTAGQASSGTQTTGDGLFQRAAKRAAGGYTS